MIAFAFIARAGRPGDRSSGPSVPASPVVPAASATRTSASAIDGQRLPLPHVAPPGGQREATTVKEALEIPERVATRDDGVTHGYWTHGDTAEAVLRDAPTGKAARNTDLHAVTGPGGESRMVEFTVEVPGKYTLLTTA
jgi:hypothetical protein